MVKRVAVLADTQLPDKIKSCPVRLHRAATRRARQKPSVAESSSWRCSRAASGCHLCRRQTLSAFDTVEVGLAEAHVGCGNATLCQRFGVMWRLARRFPCPLARTERADEQPARACWIPTRFVRGAIAAGSFRGSAVRRARSCSRKLLTPNEFASLAALEHYLLAFQRTCRAASE